MNHMKIFSIDRTRKNRLYMYSTVDRWNKKIFNRVRENLFPSAREAENKRASTSVRPSVMEKVIYLVNEELDPAHPVKISGYIRLKTLRELEDANYKLGPVEKTISTQCAPKRCSLILYTDKDESEPSESFIAQFSKRGEDSNPRHNARTAPAAWRHEDLAQQLQRDAKKNHKFFKNEVPDRLPYGKKKPPRGRMKTENLWRNTSHPCRFR